MSRMIDGLTLVGASVCFDRVLFLLLLLLLSLFLSFSLSLSFFFSLYVTRVRRSIAPLMLMMPVVQMLPI